MVLVSPFWKYRKNEIILPKPCPQAAISLQAREMASLSMRELVRVIAARKRTSHWLKESSNEKNIWVDRKINNGIYTWGQIQTRRLENRKEKNQVETWKVEGGEKKKRIRGRKKDKNTWKSKGKKTVMCPRRVGSLTVTILLWQMVIGHVPTKFCGRIGSNRHWY